MTEACRKADSCRFAGVTVTGAGRDIERSPALVAVCDFDPRTCARYLVATIRGDDAVPDDLAPGETTRAVDLLF